MPRRYNERQLVHHNFQGNDLGGAVTSLLFDQDGLGLAQFSTVNWPAPRAMRLVGIAVHAVCAAVNTPGNWTFRVRVNESGTDSATFSHDVAALPGTKAVGLPSTTVTIQAGDTYYILADGPSRNIVLYRVTLEWELL